MMRALVSTSEGSVEFGEVEEPVAAPNQAIVEVSASTINRGDLQAISMTGPGTVLGLDVVGTVVAEAPDGTGPGAGTRVMGYASTAGGWAQRAAIETSLLAAIPGSLSDAQAAPLPNGGLTALCALDLGGRPLGSRVLVTGATGGVGRLAVQLAHLAGAEVTGTVTSPARAEELAGFDWLQTATADELDGRFDLVIELVGGEVLTRAMELVDADGTVATVAESGQVAATIPFFWFGQHPGARLVSMVNTHDLSRTGRGSRDLALLAGLVADGRLDPGVTSESSWTEAGGLLAALANRQITGKAVLHVDD